MENLETAEAERDQYKELSEALDALLVRYRVGGHRNIDGVLRRVELAREALTVVQSMIC